MNNKIKGFLVYFFIIFVTIIISLAIVEFLNYKSLPKVEAYYVWPPNLEYVFMPNSSTFSGISGKSYFNINSQGYRGPEYSDFGKEYRILVTGGSTSECLYLDNKETWPYLVMENLEKTKNGKKVITMNIAKSGHGIINNILALKYLPENYDPDMIVLMTGANDVLYKLSRKDAWKPFNESEYDNTESYTFSLSPGYTYRSSISYKLYKSIFNEQKPQDAIGQTLIDNRLKRQNATIWITKKPNLNAALDDYEKSLKRVIELANEKNATLILTTQPYMWKVNMTKEENESLWMTYDFGDNYYPIETMIYSIQEFNKRLLEVCKENKDVHCLDLEKDIPKDLNYFYDDMHFNERGARLVAEELSKYIKENIKEFD